MKMLAIVDVAPGASMESIRAEIKNEIMGSWELFSSGVLREAYSTATPSRVVFILEADDIGSARAHLREHLWSPLACSVSNSLSSDHSSTGRCCFPAPADEAVAISVVSLVPVTALWKSQLPWQAAASGPTVLIRVGGPLTGRSRPVSDTAATPQQPLTIEEADIWNIWTCSQASRQRDFEITGVSVSAHRTEPVSGA